MSEFGGAEFIHKRYSDLQKSEQVQKSVDQKQRIEGLKTPNNPVNKDQVFLDRLENIFNNSNQDTKERNIDLFKNQFLYPSVLIDKDNLPDSYFDLQKRIARERGQGDITITKEMRQENGETIYNDQKKSLNVWIDYLSSKDTNIYPTWFKYYTLKSVLTMGSYDKEKHEFGKRTKSTTNNFPDLNREALSYTHDVLEQRYLKHQKLEGNELNTVLDSARFDKIYAFAIEKVTPASKEQKEKIEGEWTKFNQGDDPTALYESLQGHGTGWCTAGQETAKKQLEAGDFYVYYTKDEQGKNTIPRVAIRMEHGRVAEVRGINKDQNLEDSMLNIAQEKYHNLPGGDRFDKKEHDMKFLTQIDNKVKNKQELTKEDLIFLYEIDSKIEGFGYKKDPRIAEALSQRHLKTDLSFILDCSKDEISLWDGEGFGGGVKYYDGNLGLNGYRTAEGLELAEFVNGSVDLSSLRSVEGLKLPKTIVGNLDLYNLRLAEGLKLSKDIRGNLDLTNLTSTEGVEFPESIDGRLIMINLTSAKGLKLPQKVESISMSRLTSAEGLQFPADMEGYISMDSLITAKGVQFPKNLGNTLYLSGLTTADGLILPESVGDCVILTGLPANEKAILRNKYPNLKII